MYFMKSYSMYEMSKSTIQLVFSHVFKKAYIRNNSDLDFASILYV